jgi:hypothetical protein
MAARHTVTRATRVRGNRPNLTNLSVIFFPAGNHFDYIQHSRLYSGIARGTRDWICVLQTRAGQVYSIPSSGSAVWGAMTSLELSAARCAPASTMSPEMKAQNIRVTEMENGP